MGYQLIINGQSIIDGSIVEISILALLIILLVLLIISLLYKSAKNNARIKYEFITIAAHKFRTPLTYIKWVCDNLISEETDPFKKKSIEDINKSNQKIIDLTSTLIEIADSENSESVTYNYEKVPTCEFVKNILNKFKDSFHEKNLFFSFKCENERAKIKIDRSRFEFVITTLLENARNYSAPGKNIDIRVYSSPFKIKISVEDNGIGISKEDLPHVFRKFFRGSNARSIDTEGFGVGLYLASSIIKRFHGKIEAESPGIDQGSRFTITLPKFR